MIEDFGSKNELAKRYPNIKWWSPSAIKTFNDSHREGCQRKWAFKAIEGLTFPPSPAAQLGTDVHAELEKYFKGGPKPNPGTRAGKLAAKAIAAGLYPDRECVDFGVEDYFAFVVDGIGFHGLIDLRWVGGTLPVICDHKTSSNPMKYGLTTPDTLREDVQATVYSMWGLDTYNASNIFLSWAYIPTRSGKPFCSTAEATRDDVHERFGLRVLPVAKQMDAIYHDPSITKAGDLPANTNACSAFGGCEYAEICPRTDAEMIASVFGPKKKAKTEMGLKEKLEARRKEQAKKRSGKKAPPRAGEIQAPEGPASVAEENTVSKAVGSLTGSVKKQKDKAREVAVEAANASPDAAMEKAKELEKDKPVKGSMSKEDVIHDVYFENLREVVTSKKSKLDLPYVHGKTISTLEKQGWISVHKLVEKTQIFPYSHRVLDAEKFFANKSNGGSTPTHRPRPSLISAPEKPGAEGDAAPEKPGAEGDAAAADDAFAQALALLSDALVERIVARVKDELAANG